MVAPPRGGFAVLACREGPCAGQEFPLNGAEIVLGRATASDIAIPDTSVSRKHLRLRWTSEGWTATDLGSGNGTLINGQTIQGETLLHAGDLLIVGDTELTFSEAPVESTKEARLRRLSRVIPVAVAADAPAPKPGTWALRGVILVLGVLICGLGYRLATQRRATQARQAAAVTERARQKVGVALEEVKKLIMAGQYKAAKTGLVGLSPTEDQRALVSMYLESCEKELPNEELLEQARGELAKDLPGSAKQLLRKIPSGTLQMNLVAEVERQVHAKLKSRLSEASEAYLRGEYQVAIDLTDDLLQGMAGNREVTQLRDDAAKALRRSGKRNALSRSNFAINTSDASLTASAPLRSAPSREIRQRYQNGEIGAALELANSCTSQRCVSLARDLTELEELTQTVDSLEEKRLQRFVTLDRKVNGGQTSTNAMVAATRLGNLHYKRASTAKSAGEWALAAEAAKKALRADPDHAPAKALLGEVKDEARRIYMDGYTLKDIDPEEALLRFREVLEMTSRGDELHSKAKAYVGKLEE